MILLKQRFSLSLLQKKEQPFLITLVVAGTGLEPVTFGL
jgi:hypothetical protein